MLTISRFRFCRPFFSANNGFGKISRSVSVGAVAAVLAAAFILCLPAISRESSGNNPNEDEYSIGPRDKLWIEVWGEETLREIFEVSGSGTIHFYFLGEIQVAGLTQEQVRQKITALLADGYIHNPVVMVRINEYKAKEVQIQGPLMKPGTYVLETNTTTISKLISMAGGTTSRRGNKAYVIRGGAVKYKDALARKEDQKKKSGEQSKKDGKSGSGDELPSDIPDSLRTEDRLEVDLTKLLDMGEPGSDIIIYPGDFVLIGDKERENPASNYIYVDGAVKTPKEIEYREGLTVTQAIVQAGGLSDIASPNRTVIHRIGPDGTPITVKVRLKDIQRGRRADEPLKPGDRVTVNESFF